MNTEIKEPISSDSIDADLEKIRAENERLAEDLRKRDLLKSEEAKRRELLAKLNPAAKEGQPYDMDKQVQLEYVPPTKASRYDVLQFPDDPAEIREIIRKHALKQIESSKRNYPYVLAHIETYANEAVELVKYGKQRSGQQEFPATMYGTRNQAYNRFDRHARRIEEECGIISIAPIFAELRVLNIS